MEKSIVQNDFNCYAPYVGDCAELVGLMGLMGCWRRTGDPELKTRAIPLFD